MDMSVQETNWCHCNECGQSTKHTSLFQKDVTNIPPPHTEDDAPHYITTHTLAECCGCGAVTLEVRRWFSEDDGYVSEAWYPPRVSRKKPDWLYSLPRDYFPLLNEVYEALNAGNRILAMMGARTTLDTFINRKVGDCGNFKKGLDKLVSENYLAPLNRPAIESALEAGNAAAHRAYNPPPNVLNAVMDIVENLIQHDVLAASAEELKKEIPARECNKKNKSKGVPQ